MMLKKYKNKNNKKLLKSYIHKKIIMNEKVNSLVKKIFENILELKKIEPDFTWRNLLGDYGEYSAINNYGLIKAP